MLTKEQIKAAVDYAQMRYVDELAAAYERVRALLEPGGVKDPTRDLCAADREIVRRALEG